MPTAKPQECPVDPSKLLEEYLQLQRQLGRITDISSGIIYMLDPEGRFIFLNRAVEEILHFEPHELLGKHFSAIMPEPEYRRVSRERVLPDFVGVATGPDNAPKLFDERRTRGRRTRNLEVSLLTKSNSEVKVLRGDVTGIICAEGAYDAEMLKSGAHRDDAFLGSQGIIYDITKYKEIEQEKMELEGHLADILRVEHVGRFAGGMAHVLNNKLGIIIGYTEIIRRKYGETDPELAHCVEQIMSCSNNAAELSSQLLAFSQEGVPEVAIVDINEVTDKALRLARHGLDRNTRIRHQFHASNPRVQGDATSIQNALLALLLKVASAGDASGDLVIATKSVRVDADFSTEHAIVNNFGDYVVVTVIRTGVVMDASTKKRLRRVFFNPNTPAEEAGTGLGIVAQCLRKHRGFVEFTDASPNGTRFDLYFPAAVPSVSSDV